MNKNDWFAPLIIISLSVVFIIVSIFVFITNGKSNYWLAKKMRIGAILLSLTAISTPGCKPMVTCYDPVMPNQFALDSASYGDTLRINLSTTNIVSGMIQVREGDDFSFSISDTIITADNPGDIIQSGKINAKDGSFDTAMEKIEIELDNDIPTGIYYLNLFCVAVNVQTIPNSVFNIEIANEN